MKTERHRSELLAALLVSAAKLAAELGHCDLASRLDEAARHLLTNEWVGDSVGPQPKRVSELH